jgi:hypothetical protein
MCSALAYVRFGPKADSCTATFPFLFDHLVGERQQLVGHGQSKRFRGLEINCNRDLSGLLDRQIGWLLALEIRPA